MPNEPITNEPAGRPPRTLRHALTEYIAGMREVCGSTDMVDDGAGDLKAGWTDLDGAERADDLEALLGAPDAEPRPHDDLDPPLTAGERDLIKLLRSGVLQSAEWGGYTIKKRGRSR